MHHPHHHGRHGHHHGHHDGPRHHGHGHFHRDHHLPGFPLPPREFPENDPPPVPEHHHFGHGHWRRRHQMFHSRVFSPIVVDESLRISPSEVLHPSTKFLYFKNNNTQSSAPGDQKYWLYIPHDAVPGVSVLPIIINGKEIQVTVPYHFVGGERIVVVTDQCSSLEKNDPVTKDEPVHVEATTIAVGEPISVIIDQISCPHCTVFVPISSPECPSCGHSFPSMSQSTPNIIVAEAHVETIPINTQPVSASPSLPETGNTWRLSDEDIMLGKNLFIQHYNQFHPESQIVSRDTNSMDMSLFFTNEEAFQVMKMLTPLTPLSFHDFSQLWLLSDRDRDSHLNVMEFCMAVGLVRRFQQGHGWPATLLASCWPSMDASTTKS